MNIISSMVHNGVILNAAEKTINSFIEDENCTVFLTDEEGNVFMPKGKLSIGYYEIIKANKEVF